MGRDYRVTDIIEGKRWAYVYASSAEEAEENAHFAVPDEEWGSDYDVVETHTELMD